MGPPRRKRVGEDEFRARIKARGEAAKARRKRGIVRPTAAVNIEARDYVTSRITCEKDDPDRHRYVNADAWGIPLPHRGGREAVFTALIAPISHKSILVNKCGANECVNPLHCEVDNRVDHAAKRAGTFDPMIIGPGGKPIRKSEFEKSLHIYAWRRTSLDSAK